VGNYTNQTTLLFMDTSGTGTPVIAYTAQLDNGVSASLSMEDHWEQQAPITNIGATGIATAAAFQALAGSSLTANDAGVKVPDVVANLRVDQAWGSAQIAAAWHNDSAAYYGTAVGIVTHPSDASGWAGSAGISFNLPALGKGDTAMIAGDYCYGAVNYCRGAQSPNNGVGFGILHGSTFGVGWFNDAYYNSTTMGGLELSEDWNVMAGIAHHWNPQWQTSLWGVYNKYNANSNAVDTIICPAVVSAATGAAGSFGPGCTNFSAWQIGSRTLWNPVVNLDVSVEVMYTTVTSALNSANFVGVNGSSPIVVGGKTGTFMGGIRFQRNFWP
jgi:hypothetical protein